MEGLKGPLCSSVTTSFLSLKSPNIRLTPAVQVYKHKPISSLSHFSLSFALFTSTTSRFPLSGSLYFLQFSFVISPQLPLFCYGCVFLHKFHLIIQTCMQQLHGVLVIPFLVHGYYCLFFILLLSRMNFAVCWPFLLLVLKRYSI